MRQKSFERFVIDGITNVLNNPENVVIDSSYSLKTPEFYSLSRRDNEIIFALKSGLYGNILSIAGREVNMSCDTIESALNLTASAFLQGKSQTEPQNKPTKKTNPVEFLSQFSNYDVAQNGSDFANQQDLEQCLTNQMADILNNPKIIIYRNRITLIGGYCETYYIYSKPQAQRIYWGQRIYSAEHVRMLDSKYSANINYQLQNLSNNWRRNAFFSVAEQYEKTKHNSPDKELQDFTLQYLADYATPIR